MKAAPMPGATRLYSVPARAEQKRGKPESVKSPAKLRPPERLYIAGEGLDFSWYQWQVEALIEDWEAGLPLEDIADRLNRDQREVIILAIDLAHHGRIKPRKGGIMGGDALW